MIMFRRKLCNVFRVSYRRYSSTKQYVLGIETSCDDTGAAVVDDSGNVLGESLASQMQIHLENGGVIPHIAVHFHRENIDHVVSSAVKKSGLQLQDISAIAVTNRPGLRGSLLVGVEHAKKLARTLQKPIIPVHHMEAHALTAKLTEKISFPFLVLLASGGHCQIALVKDIAEFYLLGSSQHNSPGEVLDKIARRLKLQNLPECYNMSGGQAIDFVATGGDPNAYAFPLSMSKYRDCNFSFSGYGSFAAAVIEEEEENFDVPADGVIPTAKDFCASLLQAYAIHLMHRVHRAFIYCEEKSLIPADQRTLVFSGGVACNVFIRQALQKMCLTLNSKFFAPPPRWCTDNGVMIAWNGVERLKAKIGILPFSEDIEPDSNCPLGIDISTSVKKEAIKVKVPRLDTSKHDTIAKAFVEWRDKVTGCMQLPVIDVKIGDHEIWPIVSITQQSLVVCCLPLVETIDVEKENLLQIPSVSIGFSVLLGILNFLNMKSHEERASQLMELDNFLTLSMPFGVPSDTDLSCASYINNVESFKFIKRQPAWKPVNYKGKQNIHIKISEFVRCIQSDQKQSLCHFDVFGQVSVRAELEGALNDVTLSVGTSDKSYPLDSIILHPCVHVHGSTASASVPSLLRRLRFSPPLHEFILLQYCSPDLKEPPIQGVFKMLGDNSVEFLIQLKLSEKVKNAFEYCEVILVFFNRGPVKNSEFNNNYGLVKLSEDRHSLKWNIGTKFPKELEVAFTAKLEFSKQPILPNSDPFCVDKNCYIQINFKQVNSTLSGCNIDPKSVVISQAGKTKITIEKSVQSMEYCIWNNYGDLPFPTDVEKKFGKLFV